MKKRKAKVEIERAFHLGIRKYRWHWRLVSPYNGETICSGQPRGFARRANAVKGYKAAQQAFINGVEEVE